MGLLRCLIIENFENIKSFVKRLDPFPTFHTDKFLALNKKLKSLKREDEGIGLLEVSFSI